MAVVVREAVRHGRRSGGGRVTHVLESRLILKVMWHHMVIWRSALLWGRRSHVLVVVFVVVHVSLAHEIFRTLVLVGRSILQNLSVNQAISHEFIIKNAYILVSTDGLINVT